MTNQTPDPQELSGVIQRVDHLGAASERLFSRLYKGISRRSRNAENLRQLSDQNRQFQRALTTRDVEVERLNAILATIDEGVIMQDTEGRLVMVNAAAKNLLGSIKMFWQSELGTLFNNFRDIVALDAEVSPLSEPTRVQINNRIIG